MFQFALTLAYVLLIYIYIYILSLRHSLAEALATPTHSSFHTSTPHPVSGNDKTNIHVEGVAQKKKE